MLNRRRRKWNKKGLYTVMVSIAVLFIVIISIGVRTLMGGDITGTPEAEAVDLIPPVIQEKFITPNEYSRPGTSLDEVHGIVVHYTANPGTSAVANRNYFNNLKKINKKKKKKTYASSHFIVGIEGEIVQCVPLSEIAYASNERNSDTISIECCHKRKNGKFTSETYASLIELITYLCKKYGLTEKNVIRHYDVTGKNCPKYFVEHEDAWQQFLADIAAELDK